MATSGVLMTLGDMGAQALDPEVNEYDPKRTASMALLGLCCHAPVTTTRVWIA